jgi:hypothetical protein
MPAIVLTVARFGFLILLWIFVFTVIGVIRRDLFAGARTSKLVAAPRGIGPVMGQGRPAKPAQPHREPARGDRRHPRRHRITLGEAPTTIGRAEDSTLVITDDYASARHADWCHGPGSGISKTSARPMGPTSIAPRSVQPLSPRRADRIGRTSLELRP